MPLTLPCACRVQLQLPVVVRRASGGGEGSASRKRPPRPSRKEAEENAVRRVSSVCCGCGAHLLCEMPHPPGTPCSLPQVLDGVIKRIETAAEGMIYPGEWETQGPPLGNGNVLSARMWPPAAS